MTLTFIKYFCVALWALNPIIFFLLAIIIVLGLIIGKKEKWDKTNALYFAFITATTVGFGDFRPETKISKLLAIIIAIVGMILTGILVALGLHAVEHAFKGQEI